MSFSPIEGAMPLRVWCRGEVLGTGSVNFGGSSDPDFIREGYDHSFTAWPTYQTVHYTLQQGVLWEVGVGELIMAPGPDSTGMLQRHAVADSSAGAGVLVNFAGGFCDVALVATSGPSLMRQLASYGDGSDGDVTISSGVTLTRSMFYRNLTITAAGYVVTAGHAVFVSGKLVLPDSRSTGEPCFNAGTAALGGFMLASQSPGTAGIVATWFDGKGTPATSGSPAQAVAPFRLGGLGGRGGAGGNSTGGGFNMVDFGGGGASAITGPPAARNEFPLGLPLTAVASTGGGGGGGGGADSTQPFPSTGGAGGAGGAGGGVVQLYARVVLGGNSAVGTYVLAAADGATGSDGDASFAPRGPGGSGGGGGGGAVVIATDYVDRAPWLFRANGGNGGAYHGVSPGANGGSGGAAYCLVRGAVAPVGKVIRDTAAAPTSITGTSYERSLIDMAGGNVERGYLQADGVNHYGLALNAAVGAIDAGTAGEICMVVKAAGRLAATTQFYGQLTDVTGSPSGTTESITSLGGYCVSGTATSVGVYARNRSGGGVGDFATTIAAGSALTFAMMRRNGTRELRGRFAEGGTLLADLASTPSPDIDRPGDHVVVGARINLAGTPQNFGPLKWVATVILTRYPTPAEVAAYSAPGCRDARLIWPDAIHVYWPASSVVATSVPPLVGATPMALFGGWSATNLVAT